LSLPHIRILLVADSHLGLDFPLRPRVERRRRGEDFFTNFKRALHPALEREVDLVVHGGDLFDHSKIPTALVHMAMEPLVEVAKRGVPVYLAPGNHERSRIPLNLWSAHPNLHIFDKPRTFELAIRGERISISGFPYSRDVRERFPLLVAQTGYKSVQADLRLLCMHQVVEGATVGISDYTFRSGAEVVRGRDIPGGFAAVLSGHIHRQQILTHDLSAEPMATHVIYPGSVERTSFIEREEEKGYVMLEFSQGERHKWELIDVSFKPLPARPMHQFGLKITGTHSEAFNQELKDLLQGQPQDALIKLQVHGHVPGEIQWVLSASNLRKIAPKSMNVSVNYPL